MPPMRFGSRLRRTLLLRPALLALLLACTGCADEAGPRGAAPQQPLPPAARDLLGHAQQTMRLGDFRLALAMADSAAVLAPRSPDVQLIRGRVYTEMRRFEEAEAAYRAALALDPGYRGAWLNLGNNALRQERYRDALACFREELRLEPSASTLVRIGRAYEGIGQPDSAYAAYARAARMDGAYAPALIMLGQQEERRGDLQRALGLSQQALRIDTANLDYRFVVGSQLLRAGRPEAAVAHLAQVSSQRPWHHGASYTLALALTRLGREDEAAGYFERAERIRADEARVDEWLATAEQNPEDPARWAALAYVYRRLGRIEEAVEAYQLALSLDPGNVPVRMDFADLSLSRGDPRAAVAHYVLALRQDSTLAEAWFRLGVGYLRLGQPDRAQEAWEQCLRHEPAHAGARAHLARLRTPPPRP